MTALARNPGAQPTCYGTWSMNRMRVTHLPLKGLALVSLTVHRDVRGFFVERFQLERFREHGLPTRFLQDNHSRSHPGVLRGLHYQSDPGQGKLVGVIRGRIWDVAVDIRADSPTFGQSFGTELSDDNGRLLWLPAGFAHGFCVLGDEPADLLYKVDAPYRAAGEGGLHWADPDLAIAWPTREPVVSDRDAQLGSFAEYRARCLPSWDRGAPLDQQPIVA
jgi:dTDP-4-dehydrorhamnose 3,5-epimerase